MNHLKGDYQHSFKSLKFVDIFEKKNPKMMIKWCHRCRKVTKCSKKQDNCPACKKACEDIKYMFPLLKYILTKTNNLSEELTQKQGMCRKCLDD
mmetsp:Transcript_24417/g.21671  ORF Transcript_24417/g.21671 Transcript_24417/m.21671 type:complete len:94 (+) Transcript_24417:571-852(+)